MPVRGVVFRPVSKLPSEVRFLLEDFRLATNEAIRIGLNSKATSRNSLAKLAYNDLRAKHPCMYAQHLVCAIEVAAASLRSYRRRIVKHAKTRVPYHRRLMMKAENQAYKLDRSRGIVDLPIRAGCHVKIELFVGDYHRRYLDDKSLSLGSLTVVPDGIIITFRKDGPKEIDSTSVVSFDTNERSLDGVFIEANRHCGSAVTVRALFQDVAVIQTRHHERRKRLQRKKTNDRRMSRILCRREGRREHDRVTYRMHQVANAVVNFALDHSSTIVLEDLNGTRPTYDRGLNRRLSIWPRRKLHHCIEYKAAWKGIRVVKVDPRNSSRTCPICGRIQQSRMGARKGEFACDACGWHLDRHINASMNLLQTAISKGLEVAGGLRFNPGAFQHDVVMILYEPAMAARSEPNGTSGVRGDALRRTSAKTSQNPSYGQGEQWSRGRQILIR